VPEKYRAGDWNEDSVRVRREGIVKITCEIDVDFDGKEPYPIQDWATEELRDSIASAVSECELIETVAAVTVAKISIERGKP
jgi:hypothetical protein